MEKYTLMALQNTERIITLYEICKILGKEHRKALNMVKEIQEDPEFGTTEKKSVVYNNKGQTINTFSYTQKQALMIGARLDSKNIIRLVNELEKVVAENELTQAKIKILEKEKLELAILQDNYNLNHLRVQIETSKLLGKVFDKNEYIKSLNRDMTKAEKEFLESLPSMHIETGIDMPHTTMTLIIKDNELLTNAKEANEVLINVGILNPDRTFTDKGKRYGFDWTSNATKGTTQPRWYEDRIDEIVSILIKNNIRQG